MKHFTPSEFACKCGKCGLGYAQMQPSTLAKLDQARELARTPFAVTSAMRCPEHNQRSGGKSTSAHTRGHAVDIACTASGPRMQILQALIAAGFRRIGIAATFIHADDDPSLPPGVCWLY